MTIEKRREEIYYVNICKKCGSEFRVSKDSTEEICYNCAAEAAIKRAKEKLAFLIGAKIINIEPVNIGHCTGPDEIENIEVETSDGKRVIFRVGGYDEFYIKWEGEEKDET